MAEFQDKQRDIAIACATAAERADNLFNTLVQVKREFDELATAMGVPTNQVITDAVLALDERTKHLSPADMNTLLTRLAELIAWGTDARRAIFWRARSSHLT